MIEINSSFLSDDEEINQMSRPFKKKVRLNAKIPGLEEKESGERKGFMQTLQKSSENAQFTFFRLLRLISRYRTEYFEGLSSLNVPAQPLLLAKNFNPYFVLGFITPYLRSSMVITKRYRFKPPFHPECNTMTDQEYLNAIKACIVNKALIKQVVRKGDFIRKKHLTVKESTPNFEVSFASESDITRFINAKGKVPLIIVDCSDFDFSETLQFKKKTPQRRQSPVERIVIAQSVEDSVSYELNQSKFS
jgi:hypothetical protein